MASTVTRLVVIPASKINGPNDKGVFRAWIDESGDFRLVSSETLAPVTKAKLTAMLLRVAWSHGLTETGVSYEP